MIRIIVRDGDEGSARHVGGPVQTRHRTFDVELPELEQFLRAEGQPDYISREVIGVELLAGTAGVSDLASETNRSHTPMGDGNV